MKTRQTNIKKYEQYKDSGVAWLGKIPAHWEVKKLKHLIKPRTGHAFPSNRFTTNGIPVIRITNLNEKGVIELDSCPKLPMDFMKFSTKYGLKENDILFAMTGGTIGKVAIYKSDKLSLLNQRVCSFTIKDKTLRRIIFYWMKSSFWREHIKLHSSGGAQPNISDIDVLTLSVCFPPLQEQKVIAKFLDDKTTKIDQAIDIKTQQIALLQEHKKILIQKAVTKGLDPKVKLKDSGVAWIGEIPAHWEVKKLGYLTNKIGDGLHGTPEYTDGTNYYCINGNNLNGNILINEQTKTVSKKEYYLNKKNLNSQTLLLSINGTIGNTSYYNGEKVMLGKSVAYINLKDKINIKFIKWFLDSFSFKNYYKLEISGSTINNLSLHSINKTPIILPNSIEQKEIVNYLDVEVNKIDTAIGLKQQEIAKLKEYKQSLIDSVVTGRVRVI